MRSNHTWDKSKRYFKLGDELNNIGSNNNVGGVE
jgi:hypothetical protein